MRVSENMPNKSRSPGSYRRRYHCLIIVFVVMFVTIMLRADITSAATGGITIAPAKATIRLVNGRPIQESFAIRNDYVQPITLAAQVRGLQQMGDGSFTPSDSLESELVARIAIEPQELSIDPGKSMNVKMVIGDSDRLSPGGHYVSLLVAQKDTTSDGVSLRSAINIPIYVIKEDGAIRSLLVEGVEQDASWFTPPERVTVEFKNTGNVMIVPRAAVRIVDWRGNIVRSGFVNAESAPVFPDKTVKLRAETVRQSRQWLPGKYTTIIEYRYDQSATMQTFAQNYIVVPWISVCGILASVLTTVLLVSIGRRFIGPMRRKKKFVPVARRPKSPKPRKSIDGVL